MFKSKLIIIAVIILLTYFIFCSVRSILELNKSGKLVDVYQEEFRQKERKNQELKLRLEEIKKPEFIEKEAREKLGMGKPGEIIIIMPKITLMPKTKTKERELANWEKWWQLFF